MVKRTREDLKQDAHEDQPDAVHVVLGPLLPPGPQRSGLLPPCCRPMGTCRVWT